MRKRDREIDSLSARLQALKQEEAALASLLHAAGTVDERTGDYECDSKMLSNLLQSIRNNHAAYDSALEQMEGLIAGFRVVADRVEEALAELKVEGES